jgi:hypothetical protein
VDLLATRVGWTGADLDSALQPPVKVVAGELMGQVSGGLTVYEMTDERVKHRQVNPARADTLKVHSVCPMTAACPDGGGCATYMSSEERARELSWMRVDDGGAVSRDHPCGVYPEVLPATALGPWFLSGAPQTTATLQADAANLWLIHSPDGTRGIFAQGTALSTWRQAFPNVPQAALEFDGASSKNAQYVNDDFTQATAGLDDGAGETHCYDHLSEVGSGANASFAFLLQLLSPTTLRVEAASAQQCSDIAQDERHHWVFPGKNTVLFER